MTFTSTFHPVIELPPDYEVYDFSEGYDPERVRKSPYGIGRYNEKRPGMYTTDLFGGVRDVHMGIDIGAPAGTAVHAFSEGEIVLFGDNAAPGDYGPTIVTAHVIEGVELYALHGHLCARSLTNKVVGQKITRGEIFCWVGEKNENGGWNPHLHFQLSYRRPDRPDMPGVVSEADRAEALQLYPDPRLVLGPLY
ncbi:MAG: peptidoglycan DD-metalloendopeptidase family protein [Bdellovibrionota bacterium]|nr:MAG: peptidoglycan DD-metalloendopeptidase family protein [Bdellovibrionota bacterium]